VKISSIFVAFLESTTFKVNFNFRTGYHKKKEMVFAVCITTKSPLLIKRFKRRKVVCRGVLLLAFTLLIMTILLHKWAKVSNSLQHIVDGFVLY
jgi:hypothetical protein